MRTHLLGTELITPFLPTMVSDMQRGTQSVATSETMLIGNGGFIKAAIGYTSVSQLSKGPIMDFDGSKVGSFWGLPHNRVYSSSHAPNGSSDGTGATPLISVTKTNGSAAFKVVNASYDLEKLFESVTQGRYMAKVYDTTGTAIYGWIGGASAVGSGYTFNVFNTRTLGSQNWFQSAGGTFDITKLWKAEIYRYSTSISFSAATSFIEEVPYREPVRMEDLGKAELGVLSTLANGQYAVDYERARIYGRKAANDASVIVSYITRVPFSSVGRTPGSFEVTVADINTPQALSATSLVVRAVDIQAGLGNASPYVAIGDANVTYSTAKAGGRGLMVTTGSSLHLENVDLAQIFVDVGTNGDAVYGMYTL